MLINKLIIYLTCLTPSTGRYSSPVNSSYTIAGNPVSNIVCKASFNIGFHPPVLTFPCLTVQSQVPCKSLGNLPSLSLRATKSNDSTLEEKGSTTD